MAVKEGGRSPTVVTAMPCKLECFGRASYKKLRAILAGFLYRPRPQPRRSLKRRVWIKSPMVEEAITPTLDIDGFWPRTAPHGRWGLVPNRDDLLDLDAMRRVKLWMLK
jgi:hypothetical protein